MDADHTLNLSDYFMALKRRGLLALSIALSIVAAGTVLAIALPDVYRSTAAFRLVTDPVAETTDGGFGGRRPG